VNVAVPGTGLDEFWVKVAQAALQPTSGLQCCLIHPALLLPYHQF
jgi:hypothetical protein